MGLYGLRWMYNEYACYRYSVVLLFRSFVASLSVQLHSLKHRDQGTLTFFIIFFFWSHALWKDNGAIHVEQK